MSNNLLIETKEIGNHRIKIYYDIDAECPVTNWDMGANYIFEHLENGHYWLSSVCDWKEWCSNPRNESVESILRDMAAEQVKQDDIIKFIKQGKVYGSRLAYNRSTHLWEVQGRYGRSGGGYSWEAEHEIEPADLKNADYRDELLENFEEEELVALIQEYAKDFVLETWDSCGYSQGDHMRGIAYTTKERFDKYCGFNPKHYKTWQEQAKTIIEGEVKEIEMWAWGDVKGFVLEKKVPYTKHFQDSNREDEDDFDWEEVDSCWGYFMETEDLINKVISEHNLKEAA